MSCGGNCHNSNYVNGILNRCKISNGGKNLVNNFNQRISNLENGELDLTNVSTDIIPSENEAFDLGSNEKRFKDLYLSGNTIYLGGLKLSDNNGELEVTNENSNTKLWAQLGDNIEGELNYDKFGSCVSLSGDGNTMAIQVYKNNTDINLNNSGDTIVKVYRLINNNWSQIGEDLTQYTFPENSFDVNSSISINKDGTVLVIGNFANDKNTINVYKYENESWNNYGSIIVGLTNDYTGFCVSVNDEGSIIAFGAPSNDNDIGRVKVYQMKDDWEQLGGNIYGKMNNGEFGTCVSLNSSGHRIAISALLANSNGTTYIYEWDGSYWNQLGQDIIGENSGDYSGYIISLSGDGNIVAIGAAYNDGINGNDSGHVRVYQYSNGSWIQLGDDIDGEASFDYSGLGVSLSSDGRVVAIGAYKNDGVNGIDSGHVRVYEYINEGWIQLGEDIDGEATNDISGITVSLSDDGTIVAIGAPWNDNNGTNSGQVKVYKLTNYKKIEKLYISDELKFKENNEIKSISDKANLESPVFTGSPEVPTQTVENNNKIVNNTMLIESVNNINESNISNSSISDTTLKGNINYEDSDGNKNPMLFLNINEENGENTEIIVSKNSSGIYENTSNSIITLRLSDTDITLDLQSNSSILIYTSSSKIYGFPSV